jgi:alpha-tubulin suppressor-like RCC1 family protein
MIRDAVWLTSFVVLVAVGCSTDMPASNDTRDVAPSSDTRGTSPVDTPPSKVDATARDGSLPSSDGSTPDVDRARDTESDTTPLDGTSGHPDASPGDATSDTAPPDDTGGDDADTSPDDATSDTGTSDGGRSRSDAGRCDPPIDDELLCGKNGLSCGSAIVSARCGRTRISCGSCNTHPNSRCRQGSCTCQPKTCNQIRNACGTYQNGCGGTIHCQSGCRDVLVTGGYHTCFQDSSRDVVSCWGWNKYGQIGTGSTQKNKYNTPQTVSATFQAPTSLTAGEDTTCVVDKGTAKCWGANYHGQALGYQTNAAGQTLSKVLKPRSPRVPGTGIQQIETQVQHTCAITSRGKLYCWGYNWPVANGVLKNSASIEAVKPTRFTFAQTKKVRRIDTGALHTCGESVRGEMWCFGNDFFGGIGDGPPRNLTYLAPTKVQGFANGFEQVESGGMDTNKGPRGASFMHDFSCAIDVVGAAKCWGSDADGELGNDNTKPTQTGNSVEVKPVQVKGLNADVSDLALGGSHACAINAGGVYCWGDNEYGQLGDGTTRDRPVPVQVSIPGNRRAVDVEAGYFHTCIKFQSGDVACWGRNKEGQLGNGNFKRQKTPTLVQP